MKKLFLNTPTITLLVTLLMVVGYETADAKETDRDPVTYQLFYDNLSPYGTWINYPSYGHVWAPKVDGDFRPYATNGHWASTDEGWAWMSDYNWGWAPFHYGRWLYDDMYGWLWIPGYDWSPAWVTWGYVDDYYCWAPLIPGIDVNLQFNSWKPNSFYWNACRRENIYNRSLSSSLERRDNFANVQSRIQVINNFNRSKTNNFYYSKGPEVSEVQKYVGQKIDRNSIKEVGRINQVSHNGNVMQVYRPTVQDPVETARRNPERALQPSEFRNVEAEQARPINTEMARPFTERSEQASNIQRLPIQRMNMSNGGGERRRRN